VTAQDGVVPLVAERRAQYAYLDGMRGLAAVSVVIFHAFLFTGLRGQSAEELPIVSWLVGYGYLGVPVFIVLSGYVLMIPVARTQNLTFPHGIKSFLFRRAKRILPPYFAALVLSVCLIIFVPAMSSQSGTEWDSKIPVTAGGLISHVFLVHDVSPAWISQINGPMWSVSIEWQTYFLMPFVLIPLWKRMNAFVLVFCLIAVATAVSLAGFIQWTHPWLLGLFAAGMLAAQISVQVSQRRTRETSFFAIAALAALVLLVGIVWFQPREWASEIVAGVGFAALLVWVALRRRGNADLAAARWLESRPLKFLGLISYSIYLIHSPLLALGNLLLLPLGLSIELRYLAMMLAIVPITLFLAWLFYFLVERHFQNSRQTQATQEIGRTTS
jgi:peptidoglycan/LPS O-acetylase OafA/YrhL